MSTTRTFNVNLAFTADTAQAANQVKNLQQQLTQLINQPVPFGTKITESISAATHAAAELKVHLQAATNVKTGNIDFGRLNSSLKASNTTLSQYAAKIQSLGPQGQQAFMQLARSVATAEIPMRRANATLMSFATTLANTAKWQISSTILHGFIRSLSTAWNYSKDLNESLNNIRIVTGKSIDEMSRFADQANRAAKALSATTVAYTDAALIYYQQGLSDSEVLGRVETTIKLANVSRQSAEVVSDQMTAIWNNFYNGSKSLEYYADVITALGAATASSSEEIAQGLEKFASVAETVGLSYEYATAALATVTATTRQSADVVGTAFKTLFARLQDLKLGETLDDGTTLGQYTEHLAKVGVNIKDATGALKDMDQILTETATRWKTLDKDQQVALAKGVAGIRQYNQFISLMDNWDFMEENLKTVESSGGRLQKQAKIYEESWEAASKRVKTSMEALYSSIIDDEFFINLTDGFAGLIDKVGGFVESIGGLKGVLSGLGLILTKVFSAKMAEGFRNMAYNISMSTGIGQNLVQQARATELKQMTQMMESTDMSFISGGNQSKKVYTDILGLQQEITAQTDRMTEAEKQKFQILMDQYQLIGEQSIELAKQLELQREQATQIGTNIKGNLMLHGNEGAGMGITPASSALQSFDKNYITNLSEISIALSKISSTGKIAQNDVNLIKSAIENLGKVKGATEAAKDLNILAANLDSVSNESRENIQILSDMQAILQNLNSSQIGNFLNSAKINQESEAYKILTEQLQEYINKCLEADLTGRRLKNTEDSLTAGATTLREALKNVGVATQDWAMALSNIVSGLMSVGMLMSSISGLMDTISNPDLTGWERWGQLMTSLSMTLMSFFGVIKMGTAVHTLWTKITEKDTLAKIINATATHLQEKAQKKNLATQKAKQVVQDSANNETKEGTVDTIAATAAQERYNQALKEYNMLQGMTLEEKTFSGKNRKRSKKGGTSTQYYANGQRISGAEYRQLKERKRLAQKPVKPVNSKAQVPWGTTTDGGVQKGALKTIGKAAGKWIAVAAAVAIVATTITAAIKTFNKAEEASKKAAEQAREAATAFNSVSESYNNFTSGTDAYKNAQDELNKLTRGTKEYNAAVIKANEATMELLHSYENLTYTINDEGLIVLDEASLQEAQKQMESQLKEAQLFSLQQQQRAQIAKVEADSVKLQREHLLSSNTDDDKETAGNIGIAGAAGGAAGFLGAIGLGVASGPAGWIALAVGAAAAIVGGIVTNTTGRANEEEASALEKIAEKYEQDGIEAFAQRRDELDEMFKTELGIDDYALRQSLLDNKEATLDLAKTMAETNKKTKEVNAAAIYEEKKDRMVELGLSEEVAQKVSSALSLKYGELSNKEYEDTYKDKGWFGGGMTDEEVQKQYAEAMGWATDTIKNQGGNKATYYKKDGTEVGVISDATARRFLAEKAAMKELDDAVEVVAVKFNELSNSLNKFDQAIYKFLSDFNFDNVNQVEMDELKNYVDTNQDSNFSYDEVQTYLNSAFGGDNGVLDDEEARLYGDYENADEMIKDLVDQMTNYDDRVQQTKETFTENTQSLLGQYTSDLSINGMKMIGSHLEKATSYAGEDMGQVLAELYGAAGDQAEHLAQVFSNTDWTAMDPTKLNKALSDNEVNVELSYDMANKVIEIMSAGVQTSTEQMNKAVSLLQEMEKLKFGDTIDATKYNELSTNLQNYFTLMSDGIYKLTADALEFYRAVKQEKQEYVDKQLDQKIQAITDNLWVKSIDKRDIDKSYKNSGEYYKTYDQYLNGVAANSGFKLVNDGGKAVFTLNSDGGWTPNAGVDNPTFANNSINFADYRTVAGSGEDYNTQLKNVGWRISHLNEDYGVTKETDLIIDPTASRDSEGAAPVTFVHRGASSSDPTSTEEVYIFDTQDRYEEARDARVALSEDQTTAANKLDFLQETEWGKTTGAKMIEEWRAAIEEGTLTAGQVKEIQAQVQKNYEAYDQAATIVENSTNDLRTLAFHKFSESKTAEDRYNSFTELMDSTSMDSQAQKQIQKAYADAAEANNAEKYADLDVEALSQYADYLAENLDIAQEEADDIAKTVMNMNKGVKSLGDNWDEWGDILKSAAKTGKEQTKWSQEYQEALSGTRTALADILNVSEEFISVDFMEKTENLEDMEKAAKGDEEAIDRLMKSLSRDIVSNIHFETEEAEAQALQLHDNLMTQLPDLEVGMSLKDEGFISDAQNLLNTTKMTVEEAQAYFNSLGYEPEFVMEDFEEPIMGTRTFTDNVKVDTVELDQQGNKVNFQYISSSDTKTEPYDTGKTQTVSVPALNADGTPQIKALRRTNKGSMNNLSSSNPGGSSKNKSGGSKSKKTSEAKKKKSDIVERYKEINDQLDDTQTIMDKASKAANRLYGPDRLKQMQKVNEALETEIEQLERKRKETETYLALDKKDLATAASGLGISLTFDESGNISNYESAMTSVYNQREALLKSFGSTINESEQEKLDALDEKIETLKEAISQYDETRELNEDLQNEIDDAFYEWQDNNYEQLSYKLELQIEINDRDLEVLDYYFAKTEDDFYKRAEGLAYLTEKTDVYNEKLADNEAHLADLQRQYAAGEISQTDYIAGLKEVYASTKADAEALQDLDKQMLNYYGETLDMAAEELSKYTSRMEHQTATLEHFKNTMDILGKSNDHRAMGTILDGQAKTIKNELTVAQRTYEMYSNEAAKKKALWEQALADDDTAAAKLYQKEWEAAEEKSREAQDEMLSKTEEWAESMKAVLENKLAGLAQTLENALTGGTSFDTLTTQMERAASLQEEYLTTTNKIYETNKMINTAQKEIDKSTNTVAKQKLKSFQQETAQLQNKSKLSQYELDIQQAKYELLLAEIALEESQQAKSTVRLQRDSEGNFGYVYTADASAVADAEQKLADAQNNLYNIGLDGANDYAQKYQSTLSEMYDTLTDLHTRYLAGEFESEQEYQNAVDEATQYYYQKLAEYSSLYSAAVTVDSRVIADAWSSDFSSMITGTQTWKNAVNEYLGEVKGAFAEWKNAVAEVELITGLGNLKTAVGDIVTESKNLTEQIIKKSGVIDSLGQELTAVSAVTGAYAAQRQAVLDLIDANEERMKQTKKELDEQSDPDKNEEKKPSNSDNTPPTTNNNNQNNNPNTTNTNNKKTIKVGGKINAQSAKIYDHKDDTSGEYQHFAADPIYKVLNQDGGWIQVRHHSLSKGVTGWFKENEVVALDTGGYTGTWGTEGKIAMLHEKELVLNPNDTTNFLASLEVLREIVDVINLHSLNAQLGGLLNTPYYFNNKESQILEQKVHIEASFPNVSDRNEIEEAFNNLVNRASQFVNRK